MPAAQSSFMLGTLWAERGLTEEEAVAWYYARADDVERAMPGEGGKFVIFAGGTRPAAGGTDLPAPPAFRFACGQLELGANSEDGEDRYHIQFYVASKAKTTFTGMKAKLGGDAWRTAKFVICTEEERSLQRVEEYCNDPAKRDGTAVQACDMFRFGVPPTGKTGNQGPSELENLVGVLRAQGPLSILQAIDAGANVPALAGHMQFYKALCEELDVPRGSNFTPQIYWLCSSESGTGKTHWVNNGGLAEVLAAKDMSMDDVFFWQGDSGGSANWITHRARGKRCWVMEEARGQHCTPDMLKTCWDRGPCCLQGKGFFVECHAEIWVIMTNFELEEWFGKLKMTAPDTWERHYTALKRRLTEWGVRPNFKTYLRQKRLEKRLTEQGGLRVLAPTRRITPEPMQSIDEEGDEAGMSPYSRAQLADQRAMEEQDDWVTAQTGM